eukprot:3941217-Rhodomonas_salina.6
MKGIAYYQRDLWQYRTSHRKPHRFTQKPPITHPLCHRTSQPPLCSSSMPVLDIPQKTLLGGCEYKYRTSQQKVVLGGGKDQYWTSHWKLLLALDIPSEDSTSTLRKMLLVGWESTSAEKSSWPMVCCPCA